MLQDTTPHPSTRPASPHYGTAAPRWRRKNVRDQTTVSILHNLLPTSHPESCWTRCHQAPLHCRPYYGVVSVMPASQLLKVLLLPLLRGAVSGVAAAPAPLGVCATGSSVPLLLLVAIVLSARLRGWARIDTNFGANFETLDTPENLWPPRY
jgi:hypothetical protein